VISVNHTREIGAVGVVAKVLARRCLQQPELGVQRVTELEPLVERLGDEPGQVHEARSPVERRRRRLLAKRQAPRLLQPVAEIDPGSGELLVGHDLTSYVSG
jgi:hypothetical protein